MIHYKSRDGFTLVELLTAIVAGSLVTAAALTLLLLGVRINRHSTDTIVDRNNVDIVLDALEKVATEGNITRLELGDEMENGDTFWILYGKSNEVNSNRVPVETDQNISDTDEAVVETEVPLFTYLAEKKAIFVGTYIPFTGVDEDDYKLNIPLLEGVEASSVSIDETGKLLTFSVTTKDGTYDTSVYCRTSRYEHKVEGPDNIIVENPEKEDNKTDEEARVAFLKYLTSQHRLAGGSPNPGLILKPGIGEFADKYDSTGQYYAQWYIGDPNTLEWNAETPWCACYVSWALSQVTGEFDPKDEVGESKYIDPENAIGRIMTMKKTEEGKEVEYLDYHWFASVDWFKAALLDTVEGKNRGNEWKSSYAYTKGTFQDDYIPRPGDLAFIDWERDGDPDHVGVVLMLEDKEDWKYSTDKENPQRFQYVYTIEGNSAGIVAVRRYAFDDKIINGYGVINWTKTEPNRQPVTGTEQG